MRLARNLWTLATLLVTLVLARPANSALTGDGLQPEVLETILRMRVVAAVLDTQAIQSSYPGPTAGLVPVSSLGQRLVARFQSRGGATRDAWNNPLLYWSDGRDYLLLSLGSDGARQFRYDAVPPYAEVPRGWAGVDPSNDLLLVDGVVYRGPSSQSELLRRAMAELRSAGTACESFAVDYNIYPGPVEPADAIATIGADLEPVYIRVLPKIDPWGNPYLFWSDTRHDAIISFGPDGLPDYPYQSWGQTEFGALHTGPTTRFGQDIIFVNGAFVQWPAILGTP